MLILNVGVQALSTGVTYMSVQSKFGGKLTLAKTAFKSRFHTA